MVVLNRKGLKIKVDPKNVVRLTKVIDNADIFYRASFKNGSTIELREQIDGVSFDIEMVKNELPKIEPCVSYSKPELLKAEQCESVNVSAVAAPRKPEQDGTKYKGEMIWSHKTSPEIVIVDRNAHKIVKDVDVKTMYKRRLD